MQFFFRTDASIQMGTGHVMRCLNLASELKIFNSEIYFIVRSLDGNLNNRIEDLGYKVFLLEKLSEKNENINYNKITHEKWLSVSQIEDAKQSIEILNKFNPAWLIIDHYSIGSEWESYVKPYVKNIMVIDDLANRKHSCDLILDHNWYENKEKRYKDLIPKKCISLMGPKYALLRPEFSRSKKDFADYNGLVKKFLFSLEVQMSII